MKRFVLVTWWNEWKMSSAIPKEMASKNAFCAQPHLADLKHNHIRWVNSVVHFCEIFFSFQLSVHLSVPPSVRPPVRPSDRPSVYLKVAFSGFLLPSIRLHPSRPWLRMPSLRPWLLSGWEHKALLARISTTKKLRVQSQGLLVLVTYSYHI